MPVRQHFLGWTRPAVEPVCEFLLSDRKAGQAFDLEGTLIVVPTRQAGRHLLDALVRRCAVAGAAVLSQQVVTPPQLAGEALRLPELAGGVEGLTAWIAVLREAEEATRMAAFGAAGRTAEIVASVQTAERLQAMRRELAEGARTCRDAAIHARATDTEPERWQALATMEDAFLARLRASGLRDPCAAQVAWSAHPRLPSGICRIVVACVPDPSLLLVHALEQLATTVAIDVLIQAPPDLASSFDSWGRPLPADWTHCPIDLPDDPDNLILAADPAGQAARLIEILSAEANRFSVSDTAIGVPDRSIVPFLSASLASCGVSAFDPQERPLREHPLCRLIALLLDLTHAAPYRLVADLLRHPDASNALRRSDTRQPASPAELLTQLDTFQNLHLPLALPDLLRPFTENPRGTSDPRADFTMLGLALQRIAAWRNRLATERLPEALRAILAEIYTGRSLDPDLPADQAFLIAAENVDRVLRELEEARIPLPAPDAETAIAEARLQSMHAAPERANEAIDLEGWLELPWNPAPLLFVTGMNEGCVPDGRLADDFLPDSLRRQLGLRDDAMRAARDAFLLRTLIEARANGRGRLCLLCGKSSSEGDPLRPSRLLFRCADADLPQRALRLFGKLPAARPSAPATVGFQLRPFDIEPCGAPVHAVPPDEDTASTSPRLSVTRFRDYLSCPFRFYLRHRLGMESLADDLLAPDARSFGNHLHLALEEFAQDAKLAACTDPDKLTARLSDIVRAIFNVTYGPHASLAVQVALDSAIQRLAHFAAIQSQLAAEWEIVGPENRFRFPRAGYEIVARIDRIDRHRRNGRIRVMDYKTSEKVRRPEEAHLGPCRGDAPGFAQIELPDGRGVRRRKSWQDLQLPLYREALTASGFCPADRIELGFFALPRAVGETGFYPWENYSDDLHDSALACADGVLRALADNVFWPPRNVHEDRDDFASLFVGAPESCFSSGSSASSGAADAPAAESPAPDTRPTADPKRKISRNAKSSEASP